MDTLFSILCIWLIALLGIGPIQVIMSLVRAYQMKDWNSDFGMRLKTYYKLLLAYWIAAGILIVLSNMNVGAEWVFFLFVPVLCTALAIYYWRAVILYYRHKNKSEINNSDNN